MAVICSRCEETIVPRRYKQRRDDKITLSLCQRCQLIAAEQEKKKLGKKYKF